MAAAAWRQEAEETKFPNATEIPKQEWSSPYNMTPIIRFNTQLFFALTA